MNVNNNLFSIIIPSYNRNIELLKLLDSLEQQTIKNFEVIVVDDCSSKSIIIDKVYSYNINLIRNKINQGASISRNIGVQHANHEWVLFLDDDDKFDARKCEVIEDIILNNIDINFIYHPAICHMVYQNFSYLTKPEKEINKINLESMLLSNQLGGMPMIAIKRELFLSVGGLSTEIKALEDYEFLLKLIRSNNMKAYYLDKALTNCFFYTKRSSVSKNVLHTESAINFIGEKYPEYSFNFAVNANNMQAYAYLMNLSRLSAKFYWKNYVLTKNIMYVIKALIAFTSPNFLISLRRYIK